MRTVLKFLRIVSHFIALYINLKSTLFQIQKEREKEGDEFADKEVFVTSAYKKKLEEMKLEEEREKREEYLESIGDVTKQKDLGIKCQWFSNVFLVLLKFINLCVLLFWPNPVMCLH